MSAARQEGNMLYRATALQGRTVRAADGEAGTVHDLYFDDERWAIRYLVLDTGGWLSGRKVLLSPAALERTQSTEAPLRARLARRAIEAAPGTEIDRPVSRQHELALTAHFGFPVYWSGPYLWGPWMSPYPGLGAVPPPVTPGASPARAPQALEPAAGDVHLRSCAEVIGYRIEATDGAIGHVEDFVVDEESWSIRSLVVNTRNWLPGRHVLVAPDDVERVEWPAKQARLALSRAAIEASPELV